MEESFPYFLYEIRFKFFECDKKKGVYTSPKFIKIKNKINFSNLFYFISFNDYPKILF